MSLSEVKVCLLGYSGHGYVVTEALKLQGYDNLRYTDRKENESNPFGIKYAGFEGDRNFPWDGFDLFALGIGENILRAKIAQLVRKHSGNLMTITHPEAYISKYATIGEGTFIARGVCINPLVQIAKDVIINTSASIDHECIVGDGVHIAPGAVLAGNVRVDKQAFIGANAVIKQGVVIGQFATIGAGAVVLDDVEPNSIVFGNPAKQFKG